MGQVLHGCARTTAAVRRAIQHSQKSLNGLAEQYGINPKTVAKWKKRGFANDAPMGPKDVCSTVPDGGRRSRRMDHAALALEPQQHLILRPGDLHHRADLLAQMLDCRGACPASAPMRQIGRVEEGEDFWLIVAFQGAKMRQKSGPVKEPAEKVVKDIRRATRRQFSAERRSASCWRACAARTASPSCAVVKGSSRICITAGRKTSLRPGRSGSLANGPRSNLGRGKGPAPRGQRTEGGRR